MESDVVTPQSGVVYKRADVEEYLDGAQRENERLRGLIAEAHQRRVTAQRVAREARALNARDALRSLQQELSERRRQVEEEVAAIVVQGHQRAATRLSDARDQARRLLLEHDIVLALPEDDVEIDLIALARAETDAASKPAPLLSSVPFDPVGASAGSGLAGNGAEHGTAPANGSGSNGSGSNGSGSNGSGTAAADPAVVTPDLEDGSRPSRLSGLLRRGRPRSDDPPMDPADDEFLAFLRGALLDDEPLGPVDPDTR
jgi:hypothetical protein